MGARRGRLNEAPSRRVCRRHSLGLTWGGSPGGGGGGERGRGGGAPLYRGVSISRINLVIWRLEDVVRSKGYL